MEAHSGLSAKIVENVGFPAIWGSGLSISAQLGLRDANEASWTQVVDVVDFINHAVKVPVLLDGDTGFGNFNNARRLVNRLELLGVAGVCMEDKLFPKTNSFITKGKPQELADIEEFSLKIKACKDAQKDPDFCVVARVEALIADHGMEEALKRAEAYRVAGADAILIHSKKPKADEIKEFLRHWNKRHPVVIVPTKYAMDTTAEEMEALGVNLIIWANHNVRASVQAMKEISESIWANKHCGPIENKIATVDDIFHLQDEKGLAKDEKSYLPKNSKPIDLGKAKQEASLNKPVSSSPPVINKADVVGKTSHQFSTVTKPAEPKVGEKTKVNPVNFIEHIKKLGVEFISGVPDSLMDKFIEHLPEADKRTGTLFHHIAANEGAALALAAGYQVGSKTDKPSLIYLQNSGLGNLINPLLSLAHKNVYSVPVVIMIGWRGDPTNYNIIDEPQHNVQGKYLLDMLRSINSDFFILPNDSDENAQKVMSQAYELSQTNQQPVFVVVKAETFEKVETPNKAVTNPNLLSRRDAIAIANRLTRKFNARVSTTGKLSRELYEISSENSICKDFLMVGSMGHVLSFTQGLCHSGVKGNIVCFDGDGSILMHTGSLASVSALPPKSKLLHIGFNNGLHESVGNQPTAMNNQELSLKGIAENMGYTKVKYVKTESEAKAIIEEFEALPEDPEKPIVYFVEWEITVEAPALKKGKNLPRPKETPVQRKEIFVNSLL
eukprot:CAMPEP_0170514044 /NCGR_PEP_ID=MMETSP0209-20121228/590_1 /TAXON_ID=665100 ORGANISM="Litonotus pictus, Strain P1" /NCGR_SAMPLE_ID=MMETSP0209 /ASSEMBLY_ACC=CAM_ASM_000301 /LENGTH=724 /DNA_ID=CAMNT_0010797953 /DNA_START=185 /DNA_END=2359 /DNA_ORIENTATION=-